ncbi:MAG: PAQR family membrane homeostasis protein TrhA [Acidimicrobiales bacterium]
MARRDVGSPRPRPAGQTIALREPVVSLADGQPRPRWRGRIHLVGFLVSLPAGLALLWAADSATEAIGLLIYVFSVMLLFGTSAAYHLLARSDRAQLIMRRLDHSMIFVQIAGTYTPVCLLALPPEWGRPILVLIWVSAVVGVVVKLMAGERLLRMSNVLYILLGWVALAALPVILRHLSRGEFALLVIGGVMYTIGAVLFYCRRPRLQPLIFGYHEVWHGFTVAAALAHFGMVWMVTGH